MCVIDERRMYGQTGQHNNTRKNLHEHRPSETWYPTYGMLRIQENAQTVQPVLQRGRYATWFSLFVTQHWQRRKAAGSLHAAKKAPVCLFHSNWQMGDVAEYPCAEMTEMHLMFGRACGSEFEARTKNTSRIVEFCTEKLFPPFIDGLGKMMHLTCNQGTVKRPRTILTPQSSRASLT